MVANLGPPHLYRSFGWGDVLFLSLMGFLLGLATKLDLRGRSFSVMAAQHAEAFRPLRLPALPIAVLGALLFPIIELLPRWNAEFCADHAIYAACMVGAAVSVGAWLMSASRLLQADDRRRAGEIAEFLSDPDAPALARPAEAPTYPLWLSLWNALNLAAFIVLMSLAIRALLPHPAGQ